MEDSQDTAWRKEVKGQWRAKEQAVVIWEWRRDMEQDKEERDKVYDRG